MRFLLYNIRYATGNGTLFHLPFPFAGYFRYSGNRLLEIINFIHSVQPDIIGLVEVDSGSFRTDQECQARNIADRLGYYHVIETKYACSSLAQKVPVLKAQGNAVLSNMEIVSHRFHYFDEGVKRLVIQACMEPVTVFLVHLSLTFRKRQYQLERLYRLIREVNQPVILAGDFNVLWGQRELELFLGATGLVSANPARNPTFPSRSPKRELDYILHSKGVRVTNFQVIDAAYSDHAPLICDFECQ
ncbi:MAG: endonuclease [Desulfobulbus propionicus]|nr:MAG: endonuclease [Desulfobulbus propionicus]